MKGLGGNVCVDCVRRDPKNEWQVCPGGASVDTARDCARQDPKNEAPVIVAVKDLGEVDNDYFLIPVGIRDHEGPLYCSFPVENRLLPQGAPPWGLSRIPPPAACLQSCGAWIPPASGLLCHLSTL